MTKALTGIVTSDAADKTITVTVSRRETHPIYKKQYTVTHKYAAHDEKNIAKKGDKVIISESRPFSKRKSFKLDSVIEKSHGSIQLKDDEIEIYAPKLSKKDTSKDTKTHNEKEKVLEG